jgi:hypothetical protein
MIIMDSVNTTLNRLPMTAHRLPLTDDHPHLKTFIHAALFSLLLIIIKNDTYETSPGITIYILPDLLC